MLGKGFPMAINIEMINVLRCFQKNAIEIVSSNYSLWKLCDGEQIKVPYRIIVNELTDEKYQELTFIWIGQAY